MICYRVDFFATEKVDFDYTAVDDFAIENNIFKVGEGSGTTFLIPKNDFDNVLKAYKENEEVESPQLEDDIEELTKVELNETEKELYNIKNSLKHLNKNGRKHSAFIRGEINNEDKLIITKYGLDKSNIPPADGKVLILSLKEFKDIDKTIDIIKKRLKLNDDFFNNQ